MIPSLLKKLHLPECSSINDLNAASTTILHKKIIEQKPLLKNFYRDLYQIFQKEIVQNSNGKFLELGSGGGFLKTLTPQIISSDIIQLPHVDICLNACRLPFKHHVLDGIFMIDVFHHIPDVRQFLTEALRCLKPNGHIIMIEPANTIFSRFIYKNFHHEPFLPDSAEWAFKSDGPMSSANGALPWIVFQRDRMIFENAFPQLKIISIRNHSPLCYLISGGFTLRQLLPSWSYPLIKSLEFILSPLNFMLGMFSTIILKNETHNE